MSDLYDYFSGPATFVHLATLCYVLGLLTRHELRLRGFILAGTLCYILYYFFIADTPLWEAIIASLIIGSANLPVIFRILRERSTSGMSEEVLMLYRSFPNFNPGQFRKIMARADVIEQAQATTLLQQGVAPEYLFLTVSDGFNIEKDGAKAEIGPGNFLGEVSFLLGGGATATVVATPGSKYVRWPTQALQQMMEDAPHMSNAITVLLSKDIARKLAASFPTRPKALPMNVT